MVRFAIAIKTNQNYVNLEDLRVRLIAPICGEENSVIIINNVRYQIYAAGFSKEAKNIIMHYDKNVNAHYIEYNDFGVYMKIYCKYCDNICVADIVECKSVDSLPP